MLPLYRHQGLAYRAHDPKWAFDPASGEGAALYGGRFNKPGTPALYTATSIMGAITEAAQGMVMRLRPLTIMSYEVDHESVLDLSTQAACDAADVDWTQVTCDWAYLNAVGEMPPSWTLSETLQRHGVGAIRVKSFAVGARDDDTNLVFWVWGDQPPSQVTVIDDRAQLPRDQRSWP
ncbi:MAG: RES domain-containing protein [Salinisphaera sp.]|nr:RES domain-containing protein [Salinisphaera sp.]